MAATSTVTAQIADGITSAASQDASSNAVGMSSQKTMWTVEPRARCERAHLPHLRCRRPDVGRLA